MHIVWTIIFGLAAGIVAKFIYPGRQRMGWIMTTLLGIGGAFVATYLGLWLHIYQPGQVAHFVGAVVGGLVILFFYNLAKKTAA